MPLRHKMSTALPCARCSMPAFPPRLHRAIARPMPASCALLVCYAAFAAKWQKCYACTRAIVRARATHQRPSARPVLCRPKKEVYGTRFTPEIYRRTYSMRGACLAFFFLHCADIAMFSFASCYTLRFALVCRRSARFSRISVLISTQRRHAYEHTFIATTTVRYHGVYRGAPERSPNIRARFTCYSLPESDDEGAF